MMSGSTARRAIKRALGQGLLLIVLFSLLTPSVLQASPLTEKKAEKERLIKEIYAIDEQLDLTVEGYNEASEKLVQITAEIEQLEVEKREAEASLKRYREDLNQVAARMYKYGQGNPLEILSGSTDLRDFLDRLEMVARLGENFAQLIGELKEARSQYELLLSDLKTKKSSQEELMAQIQAKKEEIEARIADRKKLLAKINLDIEVLEKALYEPVGYVSPANYSGVIQIALSLQGRPYVWGASGPDSFDCSGFIMYVFKKVGINLPRTVRAQYEAGTPISKDQLQPGDLVFFRNLGHDGIYIGDGQFVHAPHTGSYVRVESLSSPYRIRAYYGAVRVLK